MIVKNDGTSRTDYYYDFENRLTEAQTASDTIQYDYDADGVRVGKTVNGDTTNYLVDKNRPYPQVLEERDAGDAPLVSYVYGNDLISQSRDGFKSYFHYDAQMSTRLLTDETGEATDTYTYGAYGQLFEQTGNTENYYLYTGEQYDPELGSYYLRARYYDPNTGRFNRADPWKGDVYEPLSFNKYIYANDDPILYYDPFGSISKLTTIGIALSIASTLLSAYNFYQEPSTVNAVLLGLDVAFFPVGFLKAAKTLGLIKSSGKAKQIANGIKTARRNPMELKSFKWLEARGTPPNIDENVLLDYVIKKGKVVDLGSKSLSGKGLCLLESRTTLGSSEIKGAI